MAIVGNDVLTLADIKLRLGPDNKISPIIEILDRQDEMLADVPWMEANLPTTHKTTIRTGLPVPTYRRFNQGVATTRSSTAQVEFPMCMASDRSELDLDLANIGGNAAAVRFSEARPHMQAMAQSVADTLIYGDPVTNPTTDDAKIPGISFYFKDNTTANTKDHVISASGSGSDNSSIYIIAWGDDTVCGIYPPGSTAGIAHNDFGECDLFDGSSRRFRGYADEYKWNFGLAIKDWRAIVRIANIDISDLVGTTANQQALTNLVIEGLEKIPSQYRSRAKIYCNSTVKTAWRLGQRADVKSGGGLTFDNVAGKSVMMFDGYPVRTSNALTSAEATVS